ncbi:MAG: hypothetical protein KatS3mg049_1963 [Caldilinea sp.]|uniref:Uncharacterized protein n=1 Tax=Caldilinea aerophila (strain DSM 14535 / JCM 11387 / NBRC 104270 / STL-6-O1) TaxID=926550 RepID=I0I3T6_CALAS|nr:hypothetical protein CLDAP_18840 [Caldilinea aerophila DSM 14535 = NBRC 104270]GIV73407.1 MAG: hypothetical protein KatS3mg049_1963 [Caldilinea sp.]
MQPVSFYANDGVRDSGRRYLTGSLRCNETITLPPLFRRTGWKTFTLEPLRWNIHIVGLSLCRPER